MTDAQIQKLFAREQQLQRELATVQARIKAARQDYSERHSLLMHPSLDAMRKAVSQ